MANNNVSVVVRIRPMLQKEERERCHICTRVQPGEPQVSLGQGKAFTFNRVFDLGTHQGEVYENCVSPLVEGCFEGFNATVLAYGQTGSGKTYTMGTGFDVSYPEGQHGIIPRAVAHLFDGINQRKEEALKNGLPLPEFSVSAQFIEIHNEVLNDLLCDKSRKGTLIRIQENTKLGIVLNGAESKSVSTTEETLACLKNGALFRTTGATLMNAESSRSHAIFTLFIEQRRVDRVDGDIEQQLMTLSAKFNFVDLAGSERLARTGAVGERAREGISINSGLLHLGNVISALGDHSKKASHIPYRDSKLTRILQDSLGGNSVTTMIACISPCKRDFDETLNTLRYANRAKNIENKVVANQSGSQAQLINELRRQVMHLEAENEKLRQGKLSFKNEGELELKDLHLENEMLQRDLNNANACISNLRLEVQDLERTLSSYHSENLSYPLFTDAVSINNTTFNVEPSMKTPDKQGIHLQDFLLSSNINHRRGTAFPDHNSDYCFTPEQLSGLPTQPDPISIDEMVREEYELDESKDYIKFLGYFPPTLDNSDSPSLPRRSKRVKKLIQMKKNKK